MSSNRYLDSTFPAIGQTGYTAVERVLFHLVKTAKVCRSHRYDDIPRTGVMLVPARLSWRVTGSGSRY